MFVEFMEKFVPADYHAWVIAIVSVITAACARIVGSATWRAIFPASAKELSEYGAKIMVLLTMPDAEKKWDIVRGYVRLAGSNLEVGVRRPVRGIVLADCREVHSLLTRYDKKQIAKTALALRKKLEAAEAKDKEKDKVDAINAAVVAQVQVTKVGKKAKQFPTQDIYGRQVTDDTTYNLGDLDLAGMPGDPSGVVSALPNYGYKEASCGAAECSKPETKEAARARRALEEAQRRMRSTPQGVGVFAEAYSAPAEMRKFADPSIIGRNSGT
jgi:hypothetical protein